MPHFGVQGHKPLSHVFHCTHPAHQHTPPCLLLLCWDCPSIAHTSAPVCPACVLQSRRLSMRSGTSAPCASSSRCSGAPDGEGLLLRRCAAAPPVGHAWSGYAWNGFSSRAARCSHANSAGAVELLTPAALGTGQRPGAHLQAPHQLYCFTGQLQSRTRSAASVCLHRYGVDGDTVREIRAVSFRQVVRDLQVCAVKPLRSPGERDLLGAPAQQLFALLWQTDWWQARLCACGQPTCRSVPSSRGCHRASDAPGSAPLRVGSGA